MIHLGTNDVALGRPVADIIGTLRTLIDTLQSQQRHGGGGQVETTVLLAAPIPCDDGSCTQVHTQSRIEPASASPSQGKSRGWGLTTDVAHGVGFCFVCLVSRCAGERCARTSSARARC